MRTLDQIALAAAQAISDGWGAAEEKRVAAQLLPFMVEAWRSNGELRDPPNPHVLALFQELARKQLMNAKEIEQFAATYPDEIDLERH